MSCTPSEILNFAESLTDSEEEVKLRSAVSRAYYATYHLAKTYDSFLPMLEDRKIRGGTHKQLIDRFLHINADSKLRSIGYILQDMCTRRESADYDLNEPITPKQAVSQVETAKRLIKKLEEFSISQEQEQA